MLTNCKFHQVNQFKFQRAVARLLAPLEAFPTLTKRSLTEGVVWTGAMTASKPACYGFDLNPTHNVCYLKIITRFTGPKHALKAMSSWSISFLCTTKERAWNELKICGIVFRLITGLSSCWFLSVSQSFAEYGLQCVLITVTAQVKWNDLKTRALS